MNNLKRSLLAALFLFGAQAHAQVTGICQQVTNTINGVATTSCQPIGASNPLSVLTSTGSNPSSTLTLTATTTAYGTNTLIANNATAGSVVTPSFVFTTTGVISISRVRLDSNDIVSTSWGAVQIQVDLWTAAPTWTNGDRGAWSPATGTGSHIATYACTMSAVYGDGSFAECAPTVGTTAVIKLPLPLDTMWWSLKAVTASGITGASRVFTLTLEILS